MGIIKIQQILAAVRLRNQMFRFCFISDFFFLGGGVKCVTLYKNKKNVPRKFNKSVIIISRNQNRIFALILQMCDRHSKRGAFSSPLDNIE